MTAFFNYLRGEAGDLTWFNPKAGLSQESRKSKTLRQSDYEEKYRGIWMEEKIDKNFTWLANFSIFTFQSPPTIMAT